MVRDLVPEATIRTYTDDATTLPFHSLAPVDDRIGVTLGLSLVNLGSKVALVDEDQADPLPTTVSGGASYRAVAGDRIDLDMVGELEVNVNEAHAFEYLHLGFEGRVLKIVALGLVTRYGSLNVARYERTYAPNWHFDAAVSIVVN